MQEDNVLLLGESWAVISLSLIQRFQQNSQPSNLFLVSPFFNLVFHSLNTLLQFLVSTFLLWLQNVSLLLLLESGWCGLFIVYKGFCLLVPSVDQPVRLSFQETHRTEEHLWEPRVCPHFDFRWFPEKPELSQDAQEVPGGILCVGRLYCLEMQGCICWKSLK